MTPQADARRQDAGSGELHWRDLSYDIGWMAGPGGTIRCLNVLNRRNDIFAALEGADMAGLSCVGRSGSPADILRQHGHVRHLGVRLPKFTGTEHLYLTARMLPDGGSVGTICAVERGQDEVRASQLALLGHVSEARQREDAWRREAELMLEGLRVLLGEHTISDKIAALAKLMVEAIDGVFHCAFRISRGGQLVPLLAESWAAPNSRELADIVRDVFAPVRVYREEDGSILFHLRQLLNLRKGEVAVISLPAAERMVLVCSARNGHFSPEMIGRANRFALIMKQALLLKHEQDKLLQSAKLSVLGQMSASLAHEIRQPLNAISVTAQNVELLAESGPVDPVVLVTKINRILEQIDRASQIMDRVRRFSRKGESRLSSVRLAPLADGVRMLMEHLLSGAGIRLDVEVPSDLAVHCDPIQVEQVLGNLVRNAIDVLSGIGTSRKTDDGIIVIRGLQNEYGVSLRVEDNGPGFPRDMLDRPLETFVTTKDAENGTGLGLSICHMIAREHAGRLVLGNNFAGGAFIELVLPGRSHVVV